MPPLPVASGSLLAPAATPKPRGLATLVYLAVVYDRNEAVAAVAIDERFTIFRKGDRLGDAVLTEIAPEQLVWKERGKTLVFHRQP